MIGSADLQNDLRKVVGTPEGQRLLWDLLGAGDLFGSTFRGENTHAAAYAEGRRSVTLELFAVLNDHAPAALQAMLAHQHDRRRTEDQTES
jgi:hypothetical protein